MVEIFKTNIENKKQAERILASLSATFPDLKVNVDLEDCDKILRVEGEAIVPDKVIDFVSVTGHHCEMLPE
ncbi:hypothetical protein GXP67_06860 [Rhodocytophaga rosea]|uniref:Uncharacterized protein n=1 Tax=Rhodocytophaga rosea TaxID=2704465 RepID=A0A6C0GEM1_9BACT|nr:hypothetical protein [Rhodocytophaga rosea]QHT66398.1 hypothetical protein GXP67_06860 [Rhodocytophaga rosea]